jgi:LacI family transcriptional regulator, repressor for deo operon, udp, cdd, tsx, nupC, and nupG
VLRRFLNRGVRVPADVSVVGYDDTFGSDFCEPPLTTLAAPVEQAGKVLVDVLLETLRGGGGVQRIVLPTQLRVRESTGPGPG